MRVAQVELHQCLVRVRGENRLVKNKLVATLERGQQVTRIAVEREKVCAIFVYQLSSVRFAYCCLLSVMFSCLTTAGWVVCSERQLLVIDAHYQQPLSRRQAM
jgi:hypothetical protein